MDRTATSFLACPAPCAFQPRRRPRADLVLGAALALTWAALWSAFVIDVTPPARSPAGWAATTSTGPTALALDLAASRPSIR